MRRTSKTAAELRLALILISGFAVVCFGTAVLASRFILPDPGDGLRANLTSAATGIVLTFTAVCGKRLN
jgi:hypothetical protein